MTSISVKTAQELSALLKRLIASWENEVVEFKQAGNDYSTDKIGKYFSALANEAKHLTDYLDKFDRADRAEINRLLMDKLSDVLDDRQKYNKISNLLTRLRRQGVIVNTGSDAAPCWRLTEAGAERN